MDHRDHLKTMPRYNAIFECPVKGCNKTYSRAEYVKRHAIKTHKKVLESSSINQKEINQENTTLIEPKESIDKIEPIDPIFNLREKIEQQQFEIHELKENVRRLNRVLSQVCLGVSSEFREAGDSLHIRTK